MSLRSEDMPMGARRREKRLANVRILRWALPTLAGALLVLCIVQVVLSMLSAPTPDAEPAQVSRMLKPHFSGTNPDGRAFKITGSEGLRDENHAGRILITDPVLTLRTVEGRTQQATAKTGAYDEPTHSLVLKGDVRMDNGAGSQFAAQEAHVDTRTGVVSGQTGLQIDRSNAQVQSGAYTVESEGDRVILKGGVRGRLTPQPQP
jgi:lipopolysaccharide export system protein LptC